MQFRILYVWVWVSLFRAESHELRCSSHFHRHVLESSNIWKIIILVSWMKKKIMRPTTAGFMKRTKFTANLIEYCFMITNKMNHLVGKYVSSFLRPDKSVQLIKYCVLNTQKITELDLILVLTIFTFAKFQKEFRGYTHFWI